MGKASIHFHTEDVAFTLRDKTLLRDWITSALKREKKQPGEINFIFCSDDYLLEMNRSYLNHDTLTDIITFDYSGEKEQGKRDKGINSKSKIRDQKFEIRNPIAGDIFISIDRIKENAEKFDTGFLNELHRVMIHGILHLAGYKDKSKPDKALMTQKEDFYLNSLKRGIKKK